MPISNDSKVLLSALVNIISLFVSGLLIYEMLMDSFRPSKAIWIYAIVGTNLVIVGYKSLKEYKKNGSIWSLLPLIFLVAMIAWFMGQYKMRQSLWSSPSFMAGISSKGSWPLYVDFKTNGRLMVRDSIVHKTFFGEYVLQDGLVRVKSKKNIPGLRSKIFRIEQDSSGNIHTPIQTYLVAIDSTGQPFSKNDRFLITQDNRGN